MRPPALLAALALVVTACVGPTPTTGTYREHAAGALEDMVEVTATLELVAENARRDRLVPTFATVLAREQEERAAHAHAAFASRQPPAGTDALRDEVLDLLDEAQGLAEDARILADRGELEELGEMTSTLGHLHDRLERREHELRRGAGAT